MSTSPPAFVPVAIIGMGCRFPGASNLDAYWRLLLNGVDAIREVPADRWDVDTFYDPRPSTPCKVITRNGGFLDDIDQFDPYFFGISPREAVRLDPQQRLLLEATWHAMEHAGIAKEQFAGTKTGVFMGVCTDDYITLERGDLRNIDIYLGTGGSRGSTAGRLAFAYGLRGPVAAIDTACSSSLVAVHQACNSLQLGDCDMALAGGVNVVLHPGTAVAFSQANMLSPDGRCKAFDARADGFVRSEGAGVVLLKPLSKAMADGDPIYAVIRATASNNDGSSSPFMTPSRTGQAELLRAAYARAGVEPSSVRFVEAHGTGTEVGDPVEMGALADVLAPGRTQKQQCLLGSSKTNIGHLEAAAGVAGLIKATLCLHHKVVPPNLHFVTPNPAIPWAELPFQVPTVATPWPDDAHPARAGVNSFGISGTNAHVVLEEAPAVRTASHDAVRAPDTSHVLLLSAHMPQALRALAGAYRAAVGDQSTVPTLGDMCYSAGARTTHRPHRLAIVCQSKHELRQKLDAYLTDEPVEGVFTATATDRDSGPTFVFSGIGTQWPHMGRTLLETEPVFGDTLRQCDAIIKELVGWSVIEEICRSADESKLDRIDVMQPALFSVQVALAALWRSWGVEPAAVVGHSLGEIAAACVAGALSLADAARTACERSRLMHRTSGQGRMAAVGLSADETNRRIGARAHRMCVAVVNSPGSCTVSGDIDAVEDFACELESEGVFCRLLAVNVACHSHHMDPLTEEFAARIAGISARKTTIPLYSSLLGRSVRGDELGPSYWARNLREPVRFEQVMQSVLADGHRAFVEVSASPALLTPIRQNVQQLNASATITASLRRNRDERIEMLRSAGELAASGTSLNWSALNPGGRFVPPPAYVWNRERFWFEDASGAAVASMAGGPAGSAKHATKHPLLGLHWQPADDPGVHVFESQIDLRATPWLGDHCVEGMPLFPAAGYLELALAASMELHGVGPRVLRDVRLDKALFLLKERPTTIQLVVNTGTRHARRIETNVAAADPVALTFHCYARTDGADGGSDDARSPWSLHASGHVEMATPDAATSHAISVSLPPSDDDEEQFTMLKSGDEFYATIKTGITYDGVFRGVQRSWGREHHALTRIEMPAAARMEARLFRVFPALLDTCLHSMYARANQRTQLALPTGFDRIELFSLPDPSRPMWCEVRSTTHEHGDVGTITLADDNGTCIMRAEGYRTKFLDVTAAHQPESAQWLYEVIWKSVPRSANASTSGADWIIVGGTPDVAHELERAFVKRGRRCHMFSSSDITDDFAAQLKARLDALRCDGVIYLAAPDAQTPAAPLFASMNSPVVHVTRTALQLLQACANTQWVVPPRVFVVTTEARDAGKVPLHELALVQAPLVGLSRVAAIEFREHQVTLLDIEAQTPVADLVEELLGADAEHEVALRNGERLAARLHRLDPTDRTISTDISVADELPDSWRLESGGTGVFDDLALRLQPRRSPGAGEVEIRVQAVGLNFLDVLKALNMAPGLPEGARYFGMECAGRIVAVGDGVTGFVPGDEVIALDTNATGCFRAFVTTNAAAVMPKPAQVSMADAVTMPVAYQTAYYALCELGRLRAGELVLIHSAAGGVGLAAMHIAKQRGAIILATAGTAEKRAYLKQLGATHVMNSRTLDFAREVMEFTNGRGVDLVLNSLAGEAIPASLALLATGGRFLEIGKRDIYADSQLGLLPFQRNLSFFAVDLLRMRMEKPEVVDELTRDVARQILDGTFQPLPCTVFPVAEVADAFRYMAKGAHIGKIVVTLDATNVKVQHVREQVRIRDDATYLITGGLGALGLAFARRLVEQGARHLALLGRSAPNTSALQAIEALRTRGATVTVVAADVGDAGQLARALDLIRSTCPQIRGVLHAAGVTNDRTLRQLTWEHFESVFASKVHGGWNLHEQFNTQALDFFVLFSSAAAVMGGAGQANYAAANAFLDALAVHRRNAALPALSANWGPWADVGMAAADDNRGARLAERGFESIPVDEGTELLDMLLQQRPPQVSVMPIAWSRWADNFPEATRSPFLEDLVSEWEAHAPAKPAQPALRQAVLASTSQEGAISLLTASLTVDVARILRVPEERLNVQLSLVRFGMDSLMAVELKNRIEGEFRVNMPAARLLQGPSVVELAEWLARELRATEAGEELLISASTVDTPIDASIIDVDELSDDEVNAMLDKLTSGA